MIRPGSEFSYEILADIVTRAFTGYIGSNISYTGETLPPMLEESYVSLPLSYIFCEESGEAVAFVFIAVHPDRPGYARIKAMGVVPECKGKGVGSKLLEHVVASERVRGIKILDLEVIQSNTPAKKLYEKHGFSIYRDLNGWQRDPILEGEFTLDNELQEVELDLVKKLTKLYGVEDLPWQAWDIIATSETHRAYQLGNAHCIVSDLDNEKTTEIRMATFVVEPASRRQGQARRLAKAILARCVGKKCLIVPYFPKELGHNLATELGFKEFEILQYQMRLEL